MAQGPQIRSDPHRSFNFRVEIDNTSVASFSEVTGLSAEVKHVDYREGKDPLNSLRKLSALCDYGTLTLKRGIIQDTTLWDWYAQVLNGDPKARRSGSIVLQDERHKDVVFFHFVNGFLSKIEGPHMMASGNEV